MHVLRDVFLNSVVEHEVCAYNVDASVDGSVLHVHCLAVKHRLLRSVVGAALVVESYVAKLRLLLLEYDVVNRHELKVHNLHLELIVSVAVAVAYGLVVVALGAVAQWVVSVAVHHRLGNLLVLLLGKLVSSQTLELHDGHRAEVSSVGEVRHVGVVRVVMNEVRRVYILLTDAVVGVVGALGNSDAAGNQVLNATTVDAVVKVIPRQCHLRGKLCGNLSVRLDVGVKEDFGFFWSIGQRVWVYLQVNTQ